MKIECWAFIVVAVITGTKNVQAPLATRMHKETMSFHILGHNYFPIKNLT